MFADVRNSHHLWLFDLKGNNYSIINHSFGNDKRVRAKTTLLNLLEFDVLPKMFDSVYFANELSFCGSRSRKKTFLFIG